MNLAEGLIRRLGSLDATSDYFIRILRKVVRERIKSFDVRPEAEQDFASHTQTVMRYMVWTGACRSWCKLKHLKRRVLALSF